MDNKIVNRIIELNNNFYHMVGPDFDVSRKYFWKGWEKVGDEIKSNFGEKNLSVLDLACGNGRFAEFLDSRKITISDYTGLDSSLFLLEKAKSLFHNSKYTFQVNDLLKDTLNIKLKYDLVVSFGFLHHIPSNAFRIKFLNEIIGATNSGGLIAITFWSRFNKSGIKKYDELSPEAQSIYPKLEKNDYFFGWDNIPHLERYCHLFEDEEVDNLVSEVKNVTVVNRYRSDGKNTPDNIYLILKKSEN